MYLAKVYVNFRPLTVGLITNNYEGAHREDGGTLTIWCQVNNLSLNISKTKEPIVDFRRNQAGHAPILINMSKTFSSSAYCCGNSTFN